MNNISLLSGEEVIKPSTDDQNNRVIKPSNTQNNKIIKPLISDPNSENCWIQNYDILAQLETEEAKLKATYGLASFLGIAPTLLPTSSVSENPQLLSVGITAEYLTRVNRLYSTTKMLLDTFGDDGITITLRVEVSNGLIDLFVRTNDKRNFGLLLKSNGTSSVRWREDKQDFVIYRTGKSLKKWTSLSTDAQKLKSTMEFKQSKSPLLGTSRADRDRPIVKAIVLCGNTKLHSAHADALTVFGRTKALPLKIDGQNTVLLVEQQNLIDFVLPPAKN
jgi:hypothetical protein